MKVTVFNGSPRGRDSNSHLIVEPLLEGAQQAGAETEEVFLIEKDIKYCLGCFYCWGKTPGTCTLKDDMAGLIDLFLDSDYVGIATPVYGMLMTALLKNFTDRLLPLATPHIRKSEDGSFYHDGRVKKFPRMFFIANSGFPGEHNFDFLKAFWGMQQPVLEIYRNCGEVLQSPSGERPEIDGKISEFRNALRKAGRQIVESGKVSDETVEELHAELVSDEDYMKGANEYWDGELEKEEKHR